MSATLFALAAVLHAIRAAELLTKADLRAAAMHELGRLKKLV